ncbi:MAG: transglycosylase SLT domain-containing protein [Chloroflexi bacterium]|nr:transglycosylase SLT domain-containing protein [Chloroflexota bacterium]
MRRIRFIALGAAISIVVLAAVASCSSAPEREPDRSTSEAGRSDAPMPGTSGTPTAATSGAGTATAGTPSVTSGPPQSLTTALAQTLSSTAQALALASGDDRTAYAAAIRARDAAAYAYATAMFRRVSTRNGLLAPVASLRLAQTLVSAGDHRAADAAFAAAIARPDFPDVLRVAARFDAAANALALSDPSAALVELARIQEDPGANSDDRALAAFEAAQIRYDAGDLAWANDALAVVTLQPWSPRARAALDLLESAQVPVSAFAAGYVRYRAFDNDAARTLYERALDGAASADAASAWFYIGAIDEREGDPVAAFAAYGSALELAPNGSLADDARYWRARILEDRGDLRSAVAEYDRLAIDNPRSTFTADARLRSATQLALTGGANGADALERLRQITLNGTRDEAAEAARRHTVFREYLGLTATPAPDPRSFDATVLPALLAARAPRTLGWTLTLPASALGERASAPTDGAREQSWLRATFGPAPATAPPVLADRRFLLGRELVYIGEPAVGRALFQQLLGTLSSRPDDLLQIARALGSIGMFDLQLNAAGQLLRPLSTDQRLSAPLTVLSLSFPIAFDESLTKYAESNQLPVLLLASLVRQESAWNTTAVSSANALGLTQVTVPTGEMIARDLGVEWRSDLLFDPDTALRFGAYYLGTQFRSFDGNVAAAVAAYNAGPGSSTRWLRSAPIAGTDGFRLSIDFTETASFVKRVLENYAWYRYVYAGASAPALP